jgi:hypothetical protein
MFSIMVLYYRRPKLANHRDIQGKWGRKSSWRRRQAGSRLSFYGHKTILPEGEPFLWRLTTRFGSSPQGLVSSFFTKTFDHYVHV